MTAISAFARDKRDEAEAYAAEIGGYVATYNEHGVVAVFHDNPDGLAVRLWSSIRLPEGATLQRRDSIRKGDVVVSSHSGKREVVSADLYGTAPGTMYLRLKGIISGPEAYPGDSLIPVVSRAEVPATVPGALDAKALDTLPVGAVVLDSGSRLLPNERIAWTKSDDTGLTDEDGHRVRHGWASVQWKSDRTAADLVEEFGPLFLLWDGTTAPEARSADPAIQAVPDGPSFRHENGRECTVVTADDPAAGLQAGDGVYIGPRRCVRNHPTDADA